PEEVSRLTEWSKLPVSLEKPVGEEEDSFLGDFVEDTESERPEEGAHLAVLREALLEVINDLPEERQKEIIMLRFGLREGKEPQTLEVLGEQFGVTRERIRQIQRDTLK